MKEKTPSNGEAPYVQRGGWAAIARRLRDPKRHWRGTVLSKRITKPDYQDMGNNRGER